MEAIKIKNDAGLELTVTTSHPENYNPIMGGMETSPSWEEYLSDYKDEYKPHLELVKKAIEELGWVGETAEHKANKWCFVFSDGTAFGFSWRAWGDLMSAIVGKNEGYMTYYM
jgi:hypothetical protein